MSLPPPSHLVKSDSENRDYFMRCALEEAALAASRGDVPVGAVLVLEGEILARSGNRVEADIDPTAHAEMVVIRKACEILGVPRLPQCELYVTLEPCCMCAGAIAMARLKSITFGAVDVKGGAVLHGPEFFSQPTCHHRPMLIQGPYGEESADLLRSFFKKLRGGT